MAQSQQGPDRQIPLGELHSKTMAQTQQRATRPCPNPFALSASAHRRDTLPPLSMTIAQQDDGLRLAPLRMRSNSTESQSRQSNGRVPVSHLLLDEPPPLKYSYSASPRPALETMAPIAAHAKFEFQYERQPLCQTMASSLRNSQTWPHAYLPYAPSYPASHYPHGQLQKLPPSLTQAEHRTHRFSPDFTAYSTPTYAYSETSSQSPVGTQSQPESTPRPLPRAPPPLDFHLSIRQQPAAARACGFGERDRRVIDPPPILEVKITESATCFPASDPSGMLALNCSLLSADGSEDETEFPAFHPDMRSTQRLMGTLVASPYQAKDENGTAGTFFVFPDLSCRSPGKYRLRFRLLRVEPMNMTSGGRSMARIDTDVFSVFTAKDFPGMRASSALLKALRRQGLNVGVKKGSEARKTKGVKTKKGEESERTDDDMEDSSEDYGSDSGATTKRKGRKKSKRRRGDE